MFSEAYNYAMSGFFALIKFLPPLHRELYFVLPVLRKNAYNYNLKNKFKEGGILKMKKILTVLLALSVVFTYSFATAGTAFAATSASDANTKVTAAQKEAKDTADKALATVAYANNYIAYVGGVEASNDGKTVSKTAVDAVAAELQNEINAKL